ncbi:MAG TPA: hypothetical protein VKP30_20455 [Polyangiaceae bacterium]|nr:hypothetical protein [Polyangiaceae bacterium]
MGSLPEVEAVVACADAIAIEAAPKDALELRKQLRTGSLAKPIEDCAEYRVKLTQVKAAGWRVAMTRDSSSRTLERQVTSIAYAATWVEAWLQSGFAAAPEEPNPSSVARPPSVQTATEGATAPVLAPVKIPTQLGLMPTWMLTARGYNLLGATLVAGMPARHTPWFGIEIGGATQLGMSGNEHRRAYWVGPLVGAATHLSERFWLRPAASLGILGVAASTGTQSGHSAGLYAGVGSEFEYDVTTSLSLTAGIETRLFFEHLFGSSETMATRTQTESDDDGEVEVETTTVAMAAPDLGIVSLIARLGFVFRFGEAP